MDNLLLQAVARAEKKKVGDPFDESTEQGPQISKGQFDKILDYVKKGQEEGVPKHSSAFSFCIFFSHRTVFERVRDSLDESTEQGPKISKGQ